MCITVSSPCHPQTLPLGQGHPNTRFWSTGCDLGFFHPSKACQEMWLGPISRDSQSWVTVERVIFPPKVSIRNYVGYSNLFGQALTYSWSILKQWKHPIRTLCINKVTDVGGRIRKMYWCTTLHHPWLGYLQPNEIVKITRKPKSQPKRDNLRRELCSNGRPDLPLVIFVGRLSPEKQVDKLVDLVQVSLLWTTSLDSKRYFFLGGATIYIYIYVYIHAYM